MGSMTLLLVSLVLTFTYWLYIKLLRVRLPLPPGPKGLPIIGSLFNAIGTSGDSGPQWIHYLELGKKYGSDIIHINVLGDHTVVLNSIKHASELLEKRSALYSDRPAMYMHRDLIGWHWSFASMRYSNQWRLHRKTFHQHFQANAIAAYHPFIRQSASITLRKLIRTETGVGIIPDVEFNDLLLAIQQHAGASILHVTYGISSPEETDYYSELAHNAAEGFIASANHGSFLVDYFPWLKYVPEWLPGASFKSKAKSWAVSTSRLLNEPWEQLKASMNSGGALPCFATKSLQKFNIQPGSNPASSNKGKTRDMEEVIKNACGIAYLAGADTTVALLLSCILAISYHPLVQEKAHKELDSVIGTSRLPNFSDRDKLPFIEAIFKETQRIFTVSPLALPHRSTSDDVYKGYFIPKGTTVIANVWAIMHDPEVYERPFEFNPDHFMIKGNSRHPPDPELYAFGFGRRICPGRYLALDSAWIVIACILATCNISRPLDADTHDKIDLVNDFTNENVAHPKPFRCRILPRSEAALALMENGYPVTGAN